MAVAKIAAGHQDLVYLGNLDAVRDWGHAKDYVRAMYLMLQQEQPDDYVIGTGEGNTVRDFCRVAFGHVGLDWEPFVRVDPRYFRPTEVQALVADASKARAELGWAPTISFEQLATSMVEADLAKVGLDLEQARTRVARGEVRTPV
jgi:GDPmannose 4,6-dehydratase